MTTSPVLPSPSGVNYCPDFLCPTEEKGWADWVAGFERESWIPDFKREKLCFGYLYDYARRTVGERIGPLPPPLLELSERVVAAGLMSKVADQAIINRYLPGQGISAHSDAPCFGPEIASISLGSGSVMRLRERRAGALHDIYLDRGSALALSGPARWQWTHEIIGRKRDLVNGMLVPRSTRLSITLRTVRS